MAVRINFTLLHHWSKIHKMAVRINLTPLIEDPKMAVRIYFAPLRINKMAVRINFRINKMAVKIYFTSCSFVPSFVPSFVSSFLRFFVPSFLRFFAWSLSRLSPSLLEASLRPKGQSQSPQLDSMLRSKGQSQSPQRWDQKANHKVPNVDFKGTLIRLLSLKTVPS